MLQGNGANTCSTCYPNVYSNAHLKSLPESSQDVVANFKFIDSDRQQKQECIWSEAEEEGQGVHSLGGQRGAFHVCAFIQISFNR